MKELTQIKPVSWIKFDIYGLLMLGIGDCNSPQRARRTQRKGFLLKKKKKIISHRGAENTEKRLCWF